MAVDAKICGLTRPADAERAVRLGASFLGVVFAESPRQVTGPVALEVVRAGEGVPVLGVFVDTRADDILRIRDRTGIAGAQLHAGYEAADRARLAAEGRTVWAVHHIASREDLDPLGELAGEAAVAAVLVEPRVPGVQGGTGVALPAELAQAARERVTGARFALAGGLRPETLAGAIALVRPDIVDVSSGVESAPGIKDADLLARFLEVARDGGARA